MGLFKNDVGRPSNETIKKRKIFYGVTVVVLIAVMVVSGYLIVNKFNGNLNSSDKNVSTAKPNKPTIKLYYENVKGLNYKSGEWTNKNIIARASSTSYGRKYYEYVITGAMNKKGQGSQVTINKVGTSYIKFRTCFHSNDKCSAYSSNQTIRIERTKPKLTTTSNIKSNGKGTITATCSDVNKVELYSCDYTKSNSNGSPEILCVRWTTDNSYKSNNAKKTIKVKKSTNKNKIVQFHCDDIAGNYSEKSFSGYVLDK